MTSKQVYRGCLKGKVDLAAFDLDGTLIDSEGRLSPKTITAVKKLSSAGVIPVLCTGRLFRGAVIYSDQLEIMNPLAVMNGALIRGREETYVCTSLSRAYVKKAVKYCLAAGLYFHIYVDDFLFATSLSFGAQYYHDLNSRLEEKDRIQIEIPRNPLDFLEKNNGNLLKMMIMSDKPEELDKARDILGDEEVSITSSWVNNVEIFSARASKGTALQFFTEYYDIDISRTAAFGDNANDCELLEASAFGVAMGNAVPELKKNADYITDDNNHDGVANALEYLFAL